MTAVTWIGRHFKQGVFGAGWRTIALAILMAVGVYVASKGYALLNHGPYRLFLRTPLDERMPLVKVFVLPYVTLEPATYLTLVAFLLFRVRVYQSAAMSVIGAFLVSYVFFFLLQTYVDRPHVVGDDTLSKMVRAVYAADNPYNDFPSLHVSLSAVLALHWARVGRGWGWLWMTWAAVVIAATQLIHQHYLLDIAGGLVVAVTVSHWFLGRFVESPDLQKVA